MPARNTSLVRENEHEKNGGRLTDVDQNDYTKSKEVPERGGRGCAIVRRSSSAGDIYATSPADLSASGGREQNHSFGALDPARESVAPVAEVKKGGQYSGGRIDEGLRVL